MDAPYKFVKGQGDAAHEKALYDASEQGYVVTQMTFDTSHIGLEHNEQIVVLLEKKAPNSIA